MSADRDGMERQAAAFNFVVDLPEGGPWKMLAHHGFIFITSPEGGMLQLHNGTGGPRWVKVEPENET